MNDTLKTVISGLKNYTDSRVVSSKSDWDQNNKNKENYIKNRPFYDSRETIIETENISLTFDGNLEGKESIDINGDGSAYLVKISDTPLTKEQIVGGILKEKLADGTEEIIELSEDVLEEILYEDEYMIGIGDGELVSVFKENTEVHPFSVGVWGLYVVDNVYLSSFTNTVTTETAVGELKKIDEKYLPEFSKVGKSGTGKNSEIFNDYKDNIAEGEWSHAEGYTTTASGYASHVEGSNTTASTSFSHAEGYATKASGYASHAEGSETKASGSDSHAEGSNTKASGSSSHAEGTLTEASGSSSHAEGFYTTASGYGSHTEGQWTTASGSYSHAEGQGYDLSLSITGSGNSKSYKVNANYNDIKIGRILEYNNTYAKVTNYNSSTLTITTDKTLSSTALSNASAKLLVGIAYGENSHSEGYRTIAFGDSSHAEGSETTASGNYSHAEGLSTTASKDGAHAEGYETIASGSYSHAEGYVSNAFGKYSHSEGNHTTAVGQSSHAEGSSSSYALKFTGAANSTSYTVSGEGTTNIKIGGVVRYSNTCAKIINYDSSTKTITTDKTLSSSALNNIGGSVILGVAYGSISHAEGGDTIASGGWSHAEGGDTIASGNNSHAEGYDTTASGYGSHAEGISTIASGGHSHAEGSSTTASGAWSHAEGISTTASGYSSHAEGFHTTASGNYSHVEGYNTTASGECQHVQGKWNIEDTEDTYAHIVGNGESEDARSNAHTLDWDGNAWFAGSVEGTALILKSPNGTRFNITVGDDGVLSATEITE